MSDVAERHITVANVLTELFSLTNEVAIYYEFSDGSSKCIKIGVDEWNALLGHILQIYGKRYVVDWIERSMAADD